MQRYFSNNKTANCLELTSNDLHHIYNVMRMRSGDKIEVVYNGVLHICEVNENKAPQFKIISTLEKEENNKPLITLIIPMLKEQKFDFILQKATEMNVTEIIVYEALRSVVKLDDKKQRTKLERWHRIIKEASEQSKRLSLPTIWKVHKLTDLKELLGLKVICSTNECKVTIKKFLTTNANYDRINIVIGPEGGFAIAEENLFCSMGFTKVTLGHLIMRSETVPLYLMSVLNYEYME